MTIKERLRAAARTCGFDRIGFAAARDLGPESGLDAWLAEGHEGTMRWMGRAPERRRDPRRVLPGARTVVSLAVNYFHPARHEGGPGTGRVSRYAWGGDYHRAIERQLRTLVDHLRRDLPGVQVSKGHVDTAPVAEKAWAHTAGVGWVGKHSNVITRDRGSWVFLAELLMDAEVEPDPPATDHCGTCTRCIDACPTAAIVAPAVVDSRRCISYLTIEHRDAIDPELRPGMGDWIFGCDICQDVCPWNKFSRPTPIPHYAPRPDHATPRLTELARLGPQEFAARFAGTNLRRPGWRGFLRNVMVALGNSPAAEAVPTLISTLEHPEPLVRGHAAWALGRHAGDAERLRLRHRRSVEADPAVRAEIEGALR